MAFRISTKTGYVEISDSDENFISKAWAMGIGTPRIGLMLKIPSYHLKQYMDAKGLKGRSPGELSTLMKKNGFDFKTSLSELRKRIA